MQVSWYWIKQRPHFVAEGLSDDYDILVVDRKEFKKTVKNESKIRVTHPFRLPFERYRIVDAINSFLYRIQFFFYKKNKGIVWITNPIQYKWIGSCKGKKLVYDCMDDMPSLSKNERMKSQTIVYEKKLLKDADLVFASSGYLRDKLLKEYGERDIIVVNNAIKDTIEDYKKINTIPSNIVFQEGKVNLTYIGTLSSWFDYEMVIKVLDKHSDWVLNLFGPSENLVPTHPQIIYHGSIEHQYILKIMERSDVLVMPFIVNELIRSVNPVKLYEYIYSGRPCVAPRYGETEQFSEYVRLYNNHDEFEQMISEIVSRKYTQKPQDECERFALQNTWHERITQIKKYLVNG